MPSQVLESASEDDSGRVAAPRAGEVGKCAQMVSARDLPGQFFEQAHPQGRISQKSLVERIIGSKRTDPGVCAIRV